MSVGLFELELLFAAFAGGAFGAAIGALPAFVLTGVSVVIGETVATIQRAGQSDLVMPPITDMVAFGVVFGPHVSFAGGAAAAAYAARRGYLSSEHHHQPAKAITVGLGSCIDVLVVGGAFGMIGHLLLVGSTAIAAPWDPVAMAVVVSAFLHRAIFGYELMGPVSRRDLWRIGTPTERIVSDGGFTRDMWLPYMAAWHQVAVLGGVAGVLGGYLAYITASPFLGFGLSAASLLFIVAGVERIPVTHHMTLPASTAVLAFAGLSLSELSPAVVASEVMLWEALVIGGLFGMIGGVAGELVQRLFYARAKTHLDPPAASIVLTTALIALLAIVGYLDSAVWIPHP